MDFPTKYDIDNKDIFSECGTPTLQEYTYKLDDDGHKVLVKKDSFINVYERIQADRDSTDINKLMERFALGDTEALDINKGFYIDARDLPKNLREVYDMGLEAEQYFDSLPVEFKAMFDNSHSVFFTEMSNDPKLFEEKYNKYNDRFVNHQFESIEEEKSDNEVSYNE